MNERIRELVRQAGDYVNETYTGPVRSKTPGKIWEDGHIGWHTQFNQKFAELIVRECIDKIETHEIPVGNSAAGEMACEWTYAALKEIRDEIKEHFGVEE